MKELRLMLALLVVMVGFVIFSEPVGDFIGAIPYKFGRHGKVLQTVSAEIEKRFDAAVLRGGYGNGSGEIISYSSFHDEQNHAYFYRITNHAGGIYVKSRIFLIFLGEPGVWLDRGKSFYIEVKDPNPPVRRGENLYLFESKYSLNGGGGFGMGLVMPKEKPKHRLVWKLGTGVQW